MGHSITWDNEEKTVLLQAYTDVVTKDDLYHLVKKSAEILSTCEHAIHIIIDERLINFVLNSADLRYTEKMLPPNQGAVIVIVLPGNLTYKKLVQERFVQTVSKDDPHFVETPGEARTLLQEKYGVRYPVTS